jgi:hypothetical protein
MRSALHAENTLCHGMGRIEAATAQKKNKVRGINGLDHVTSLAGAAATIGEFLLAGRKSSHGCLARPSGKGICATGR